MTEFMPENDVIIEKNVKESSAYPTADEIDAAAAPAAVDTPVVDGKEKEKEKKKKKKSGAFGIFRAALSMLRKRRKDKSGAKTNLAKQDTAAPNVNNNSNNNANWTKLVGSVRPLHLPETAESPPPAAAPVEKVTETVPPASPTPSSTTSKSPSTMSQYASSSSLLDLDNSSDEEERDPDEVFDAISGDEMIDAKAEEFIAQFYRQIQLQKTARSYHHHHHHRHQSRGI